VKRYLPILLLSLTFLATVFLTACAQADRGAPPAEAAAETQDAPEVDADAEVALDLTNLKLIRNGSMQIEVEDVGVAARSLQDIAAKHGGYTSESSSEQRDAGPRQASVTVLIPSANFDALVQDVRTIGDVEREELSTQDVTKAYADLETRLAVKRQTETRLREIMASRTGSMSDVLQVERELSRLTGEIEDLLGQKRYFDQKVATSTLRIQLFEPAAEMTSSPLLPLGTALNDSLTVMSRSISMIVYLLAFVTPWALLCLFGFWIAMKLNRRSAQKPQ